MQPNSVSFGAMMVALLLIVVLLGHVNGSITDVQVRLAKIEGYLGFEVPERP